jgi:hypothetical protein
VLLESPVTQSHHLKVNAVADALKPKLGDIKGALAGKPLLPCDASAH